MNPENKMGLSALALAPYEGVFGAGQQQKRNLGIFDITVDVETVLPKN